MIKINLNQIIYFYVSTFILSCILGYITIDTNRIWLFIGCLFLIFAAPVIHYYFEFKTYVSSLNENEEADDTNNDIDNDKNEYYIYDNSFSNGFVVCGIYNPKTGITKFNFKDKNGKLLLDTWYNTVTQFYKCGVAVIGNTNYYEKDNTIIQEQYYKIIDKSGKPINLFEYIKVGPFSDDGIAKVTLKDGKINYVNISGEHLWPEWKEDDTELFKLTYNE